MGVVAYLRTDDYYSDVHATIPIRVNDRFYLGRDRSSCRRTWSDARISNKHLIIHCVSFDDAVEDPIPLVYVEDLSTNGTTLITHSHRGGSDVPVHLQLRGKSTGSVLLSHRDELLLAGTIKLTFTDTYTGRPSQFDKVRANEQKLFEHSYVISKRKLGSGGQGSVYMALERGSGRQFACKTVEVDHTYDERRAPKLFRELEILKQLSHPNVIMTEKVFWTTNTIYLFQELITGGDLFSYIEFKDGKLSDGESCTFMQQILKGLEYLHGLGIVHRDLKPDNILVTSLEDCARLVITDFGSARYLPRNKSYKHTHTSMSTRPRMMSLVGTTEYCAPEVYSKNPLVTNAGYTEKIDMWSVGCICAALLSGDVVFIDRMHTDFRSDPQTHVLQLAARCNLDVLDQRGVWSSINNRPKDLIRQLLTLDEDSRLTAKEALAHPWFTNECYVKDLQAVYNRATASWAPRRKTFQLVERLKTTDNVSSSDRSPIFQQQQAPGSSKSKRKLSPIEEARERDEGRGPGMDLLAGPLRDSSSMSGVCLESQFQSMEVADVTGARGTAMPAVTKTKRKRGTSLYDEGLTDLEMQDVAIIAYDSQPENVSKKSKYC